jgi:hypothetical protein
MWRQAGKRLEGQSWEAGKYRSGEVKVVAGKRHRQESRKAKS